MENLHAKDSLRSHQVLGSLSDYLEGLAQLRSKDKPEESSGDCNTDELPEFIQAALESCPTVEKDLLAAYKQVKNDRRVKILKN